MSSLNDKLMHYAGLSQQETEKQAAKKLDITKILSISANIKALHVKTKRYSQHMALDAAFDDLNDAVDSFNECVQGYYLMKDGSRLPLENATISFKLPDDDKVTEAVKALCKEFKEASSPLTDGQSPLVSAQDDVLNCFYQLIYRLDLKN